MRWPFKREKPEDIEWRGKLAEAESVMLRQYGSSSSVEGLLSPRKYAAKSLRGQFKEDLEEAWTPEEREEVVRHWINKRMKAGNKFHVAFAEVMRWLEEIQRGLE